MKQFCCFFALIAFFSGACLPAYAETVALDDASIRALYARSDTAVGNSEKTRLIMEERLADKFTLKSSLTQLIGDSAPILSDSTFGKRQVIENALRGYSVMHVDHYQKIINEIRYSDDLNFAFVTTTTASSGTLNTTSNGTALSRRYEDGESCIDQMTLIKSQIKFVQSVCNERFVVKEK